MRGRTAAFILSFALASGFTVPAGADPSDTASELQETREQIEQAEQGLDGALARLEQAQADLAAADEALAAATSDLHALEGELAAAEAVYDSAVARTTEITERVIAADARLDAVVARRDEQQAALNDRAAEAYMRGGSARIGEMYSSLLGSSDVNELMTGLKYVEVALDDERQAVEAATDLVHDTADIRAELAELRAEHVREQEAAQAARDEVARITTEQAALVSQVEAERAHRDQVLAQIEADAEQMAALIEQLEAKSVELTAVLLQNSADYWRGLPRDGPLPDWASRLPAHAQEWAPAINEAALRSGVDPRLFAALVWAESYFHPGAVSHAGALGLAQLMPGTASALGVDPYDPLQNLAGGARYLGIQLLRFGRLDLALAAYNAGPGAVEQYGGVPPYAETQGYVLRVLGYYEQLIAP